MAQQGARTRGGPATVLDPCRDQQPVQRGATGLEQGFAHVGIQAAMILLIRRQPVGQARLEPHAAGLERGQPDGFERRAQLVRVVFPGPPNDKGRGDHRPGLQRADGRLAVIVEKFDQFVDDFGFVFLAGPGVTLPLPGQHFRSCFLTHFDVHSSVTSLLSQRMVSSIHFTPPSVTFFLSQFAPYQNPMPGLNLTSALHIIRRQCSSFVTYILKGCRSIGL